MDLQTVLGLFVYANDANEIDIELSRWGEDRRFSYHQFVMHPVRRGETLIRSDFSSRSTRSAHGFRWNPAGVLFESYANHRVRGRPFKRWLYEGPNNFKPSTEKVHINHWLYKGHPPAKGGESEVIIEKFIFVAD